MPDKVSSLYEKYSVRQLRLPRTVTRRLQIRSIPGKGRGVFANHSYIPAGTLLFREKALVYRFKEPSRDGESREATNERLEAELRTMSAENKQKFVQLSWSKYDDEYDRVETNNFHDSIVTSNNSLMPDLLSIWWLTSFFNHSCMPNCDIMYDNGWMTVKTIVPVNIDTELTISYLAYQDLIREAEYRIKRLQAWGFQCNCDACNPDNRLVHDSNRDKIEDLCYNLDIGDSMAALKEHLALDHGSAREAEELILLLRAQNLRFLLANAHTKAIEAWSLFNDEEGDSKMEHHQTELISIRKVYDGISNAKQNGLQLGSKKLADAKDVFTMRRICEYSLCKSNKRPSGQSEDEPTSKRMRSSTDSV